MTSFKTAWTYYSEEYGKRDFLSTGNKDIDHLIGGGIAYGTVTEIAGEAGAGKSQFCMQLAASSISKGKEVLYIDTEKGSSLKRINQLLDKFAQNNGNCGIDALTIAEPNSVQTLLIILKQIMQKDKVPDVIILDSIAAPFRGEDLLENVMEIDTIAIDLCKLACQKRSAVVCTNHVTTKIDVDGSSKLLPSLGAYWSHRPTNRLWMERINNKRYMELKKCSYGACRRTEFQIREEDMKFSASFSDQGAIETFTRCVTAMSRMSRKKFIIRMSPDGMCLITCPATGISQKDGIEYWIGVLFPWQPTFTNHAFAGLSDEKNEIVIDVDASDFSHCLSGNHANTKLRLVNRDNVPYLKIEIRSHNVTHELPVNVVQSKKWVSYDRPNCDGEKAIVALPPSRTMLRVLNSMKNIHCKFVNMKVSSAGDLHLQTAMSNGDINVYFSDLVNDPIQSAEGADNSNNSQTSWFAAKLHVKPLQQFFNHFLFAHGKVKLAVLNERAAEFSIIQEDFEVSFVIGDTSE